MNYKGPAGECELSMIKNPLTLTWRDLSSRWYVLAIFEK